MLLMPCYAGETEAPETKPADNNCGWRSRSQSGRADRDTRQPAQPPRPPPRRLALEAEARASQASARCSW